MASNNCFDNQYHVFTRRRSDKAVVVIGEGRRKTRRVAASWMQLPAAGVVAWLQVTKHRDTFIGLVSQMTCREAD
jgi:hypothetical protein